MINDPEITQKILEDCEPVVLLVNNNFEKAVRGKTLFWMGDCGGLFTMDKNNDCWHSFVNSSSHKSYNEEEFHAKLELLENEYYNYLSAMNLFN